jgi:hypothetical protein
MYLVDTNIWLERLLDQERSEEVGQFPDLFRPINYSSQILRCTQLESY